MNRSRLLFGLVFVTVGGLRLADLAGADVAWTTLAAWWPVAIVVLGIVQLLTPPRNVTGGVFSLLLGGGLLAFTLGAVDSLAVLWPLLLVAAGLWLLLARPPRSWWHDGATVRLGDAPETVAVFDDRRVQAPPGPFTGTTVTAVFGDLHLDLSAATLPHEDAVLQVNAVFGDVEVVIPPDWHVTVSGPEVFGQVRVPPAPTPTADASPDARATPVLRLRSATIFGDLTVHAARPATTGV